MPRTQVRFRSQAEARAFRDGLDFLHPEPISDYKSSHDVRDPTIIIVEEPETPRCLPDRTVDLRRTDPGHIAVEMIGGKPAMVVDVASLLGYLRCMESVREASYRDGYRDVAGQIVRGLVGFARRHPRADAGACKLVDEILREPGI